jgi:hypothetical protein
LSSANYSLTNEIRIKRILGLTGLINSKNPVNSVNPVNPDRCSLFTINELSGFWGNGGPHYAPHGNQGFLLALPIGLFFLVLSVAVCLKVGELHGLSAPRQLPRSLVDSESAVLLLPLIKLLHLASFDVSDGSKQQQSVK